MINWIDTTGGPTVLIPKPYLSNWKGTFDSSGNIPDDFLDPAKTHYGKACETNEDIEIIEFNGFNAIVFGDEPLLTTAISNVSSEIIFIRWVCGNSLESAEEILNEINYNSVNWKRRESFINTFEHYILFDSSENGIDVNRKTGIDIRFVEGKYEINSATFNPNSETQLLLYRFQKQ